MSDVPVRVRAGRAERVDADRQRRGEAREAEPSPADHPRVGQRVKLARGLFDGSLEVLEPALGIPDRAVDPDAVDARADLGGELRVNARRLFQRLLLVRADEAIAPFLVQHRCAKPLPAAALPRLLPGPTAHTDVHGERRRQRTTQQVREPRGIGVCGWGSEVQNLLERAVGVAQPARVLTGIDPAHRTVAGRKQQRVTRVACLLVRRGRRDAAGCGEAI